MTKIRQPVAGGQLGGMAPRPQIPSPVKPMRTRSKGGAGSLVPVAKKDVYQPDAEDRRNAQKIVSQFSKHREALKAAQDDPGEKSMMIIYQALLDMVLNLIPLAESKYREGTAERAAYALNVYINQARELQNDMRALHDFSQTGYRIVEIVAHSFTLIAQNLVGEKGMVSQELMLKLSPVERQAVESAINNMVQNQGRYMNETLKSLRDQIMAQFIVQSPQGQRGRQTVVRSR